MNLVDHIKVVFLTSAYILMRRVKTSPTSIIIVIVISEAYLQSILLAKWESMYVIFAGIICCFD